MVNEEIFEGLKRSTGLGGTLKSGMMSFYNSGYKKQDIEEAAKALQSYNKGQPIQFKQPVTPRVITQPISEQAPSSDDAPKQSISPVQRMPTTQKIIPVQPIQPGQIVQQNIQQVATAVKQIPAQVPQQMNQQIASNYNKKSKISGLTITLIVFLVLLFGALISMFVFKDALISFLNNAFS